MLKYSFEGGNHTEDVNVAEPATCHSIETEGVEGGDDFEDPSRSESCFDEEYV